MCFSSEQERWETLSNTSVRVGHQLRQAMADEPLRSAAHHPATARDSNQRVNQRIADLGEEATARRTGAQGAYPSYSNNDNQVNFHNQHHDNLMSA